MSLAATEILGEDADHFYGKLPSEVKPFRYPKDQYATYFGKDAITAWRKKYPEDAENKVDIIPRGYMPPDMKRGLKIADQLQKLEEEKKLLEQEKKIIEIEKNKLVKQVQEEQEELDAMTAISKQYRGEITELEKKLKAKGEENDTLKLQYNTVQKEKLQLAKLLDDNKQERKQDQTDLQEKAQEIVDKYRELQAEHANVQKQLKKTERSLKQAEFDRDLFQRGSDSTGRLLDAEKKKNSELEASLEELKENHGLLQGVVNSLPQPTKAAEKQELEQKWKLEHEKYLRLEQQLKQEHENYLKLEQELVNITADHKLVTREHKSLVDAADQSSTKLQQKILQLEQEKQLLEQKFNEAEQRARQHLQQKEDLKQRLAAKPQVVVQRKPPIQLKQAKPHLREAKVKAFLAVVSGVY